MTAEELLDRLKDIVETEICPKLIVATETEGGEGNYCPENCRWADTHLQGVNQKIQKNNKSGYKGARYNKTNNKYMADIKVCRKYHFLGYFNTLYEAVMARNNFIIQNNLSEYKIQEWKGEKA